MTGATGRAKNQLSDVWRFDESIVEKVLTKVTVVKMSQSPFYELTWSHSDINISKETYWE